ncbi:adenine phosphoribosyltransferase [Isachenkonia alkalipeptolytica]|uniref:Adenine phosphoribosyltransferase n=1 Tax=Isachenkonia alkalipeptolytica TaxID=2565777 RepID=A0AA43XMC3_9CLOT|nr:adenine phosphoribosyltransferase [Isachenkonia alkalipeptolytica]NBG88914.1 adenine phosphoribosyltransferase [Isachenkonia alkalipeptolytica]
MDIKSKIREVQDFPKEGINFKDITTLLKDKAAFQYVVDQMSKQLEDLEIDIIVGPEARGFIMGTPVAYKIGAGFVPVRKPNKLPAETLSYEYELEYGTDSIEIHKDAIQKGQRVAIVDDLLATGGTVLATTKLIEELGGEVVSINFLMVLSFLNGKDLLKNYKVESLIEY